MARKTPQRKREESRSMVYVMIDCERDIQDKKWGGVHHDVTHSFGDWQSYVLRQIQHASTEYAHDQQITGEVIRQWTQAAALLVAAIEAAWENRNSLREAAEAEVSGA